jgi:hypothetical protein
VGSLCYLDKKLYLREAMSLETQPLKIITWDQLVADSNHYFWRTQHGEAFTIFHDGKMFATLAPPSKKERNP